MIFDTPFYFSPTEFLRAQAGAKPQECDRCEGGVRMGDYPDHVVDCNYCDGTGTAALCPLCEDTIDADTGFCSCAESHLYAPSAGIDFSKRDWKAISRSVADLSADLGF